MVKLVTDPDLRAWLLRAETPVLATFWCECGPCRSIHDTLHALSIQFAKRLVVAKVEIDRYPEAAKTFGVRGAPTSILFRRGVPGARRLGSLPQDALARWLEAELG